MLGRNQAAQAEIDLGAAERLGVQIVRRSSGGGTIFTDGETLQYSVILPYDGKADVKEMERTYIAEPMLKALNAMGVPAEFKGRNDLLVDGKKVSGLAQYVHKDYLCNHGSLLYDTDLELLSQVLQVDEEKIRTKALRSIRSRVASIAGYISPPRNLDAFWKDLKGQFFGEGGVREYVLSREELAQVEAIQREKYANPDWIFGKTPPFSYHNEKRFALGKVEVYLDVDGGVIKTCKMNGDFLGLTPVRGLEEAIEGLPYRKEILQEVLSPMDLRLYLGGITAEELLSCLFA
ncbi:lipoate--protein ligase [Bacteroidia bacterium]|nr:lipoate--protein ligase [Bacteroidia bacterium]